MVAVLDELALDEEMKAADVLVAERETDCLYAQCALNEAKRINPNTFKDTERKMEFLREFAGYKSLNGFGPFSRMNLRNSRVCVAIGRAYAAKVQAFKKLRPFF